MDDPSLVMHISETRRMQDSLCGITHLPPGDDTLLAATASAATMARKVRRRERHVHVRGSGR